MAGLFPPFFPPAFPASIPPAPGGSTTLQVHSPTALPEPVEVSQGGVIVANLDTSLLYVRNTTGSPVALTVPFEILVDGQRVYPRVVEIPANTSTLLRLGPARFYGRNTVVKAHPGLQLAALTI